MRENTRQEIDGLVHEIVDVRPTALQIDDVFDDDFIDEIVNGFSIDLPKADVIKEIRYIGLCYIRGTRGKNFDKHRMEACQERRADLKVITKFIQRMRDWETIDIAGFMIDAARQLGEPLPQTHFPALTDHQRHRGEGYYYELLRLLELARKGVEIGVEHVSSKGGHPVNNYGLEALTRKAADFWIDDLKRPFRVDHNRDRGVSEAFCFVQTLAQKLEGTPDAKIISAMRAEKSRRAKIDAQLSEY